jgi:transposase
MTEGMTRRYNEGEVLSGVQRRRRWTPEEKVRIVEETYLPGMSVSLVARRHGISGSQVFTWRRLMSQGALTAAAAGEEVVPASEYRALEAQGARAATPAGQEGDGEMSCCARPCPGPQAQKNCCCARPRCPGMVCDGGRRRFWNQPPAPVRDA